MKGRESISQINSHVESDKKILYIKGLLHLFRQVSQQAPERLIKEKQRFFPHGFTLDLRGRERR